MKTFFYSIAHFAVDLCSALLLFRYFTGDTWMLTLLLYNFCAFALQLPFGILADRLDRNAGAAGTGMLLIALAFLSRGALWGAILCGCGNALFHIGGGIEILNRSIHKAVRLGLFVAPGALGLYLGTHWGQGDRPLWFMPILLAITGLLPVLFERKPSGNTHPEFPRLSPALLALFGVVVLRSYLGFCMVFSWNNGFLTGFALITATVLGKISGGWLLDRMGYLPAAFLSLLSAAGFLLFPDRTVFGLLGVFFFQMTMPMTLWAAGKACPGAKGFSFGLLTFALFLGFLPILFELRLPADGLLWAMGALSSLVLLILGRRCAA